MSDQNQILRLLATIREESAAIRSRQEELYELLASYKDQIDDLKRTLVEKLAGLPRSPYIAGQLVPAPDKLDGVDDFRQVLATYLHKHPFPEDEGARPVNTVFDPPREVKPEEIELEEDEDPGPRRRRGGGPPRDMDLERGPDRDIEQIDLDEPDEPEKSEGEAREGGRRRRSRGGRRRRGGGGGAEREGREPREGREARDDAQPEPGAGAAPPSSTETPQPEA